MSDKILTDKEIIQTAIFLEAAASLIEPLWSLCCEFNIACEYADVITDDVKKIRNIITANAAASRIIVEYWDSQDEQEDQE